MRQVTPGKLVWTMPHRINATQIRFDERLLGRAPIDIRMRVQGGDSHREIISGKTLQAWKGTDSVVGAEIRIRASKQVRQLIGKATGTLEFWAAAPLSEREDGEVSWQYFRFPTTDLRATCCRLLGYAGAEWEFMPSSVAPPE